ncbi:MAG: ABC transporter ATP-binding protein [Verrucomicrobiales bacterium]|nr:ABC transporter ATP-binding protein [Verrucomicrobiales bacterium]
MGDIRSNASRDDATSGRGAGLPTGGAPLWAQGVEKSYEGRAVLCGVTLEIQAGERVALMGPSGSGKTTLLNCLGGVDRADRGSVRVGGCALEALDDAGLARMRREKTGTVFQFFHLLPTLSAYENVELPLQLLGVSLAERRERVGSLLARVGVEHRAGARPAQLSGGEQQRVALARAMVHRPGLLLADEPTGNLDSVNGAKVLELLRELSDETGTTLLLVTHSSEAAAICHRRVMLRDGRVEGSSTAPV